MVATLFKIDGFQSCQITVHVMSGYVEAYYESDGELSLLHLFDSQNTVKRFFRAMVRHLESLPSDELKN